MAVTARPAETITERPGGTSSRATRRPPSDRTTGWSSTLLISAALVAAVAAIASGAPVVAALTVVAMLPAAVVDLREHRLPNRLVALAAAAWSVAFVVERLVGGRVDDVTVRQVLVGLVTVAGPLLAMHLVSPAAMGFGDVKAAAVLGAAVGVVSPAAGLLALAVAGGLGTAIGLAGRRRSVAFGPALVLGTAIATAIAPWLIDR